MSRGDRKVGGYEPWSSSPKAVAEIRDVLVEFAATGALRLVLQQLTLHEDGREAGIHEEIDAIVDVGGNLVSMSMRDAVRADVGASTRLDAAISRLRAEVAANRGEKIDSLSVVLDADSRRVVLLGFDVDVSPQDLEGGASPDSLHDGEHHIRHHAPTLEDLRDRMAGPEPGVLERALKAVRERWRRARG